MTKTCTKCGETKLLTEFNFKNKAKGQRHGHCRVCTRIASRAHYRLHCVDYKELSVLNRKRYRTRNRIWIFRFLEGKCCVDCDENDPRVLEFHHTEDNKEDTVGRLVRDGLSLKRVQREVSKCTILCKNCHFLRTVQGLGGHPFDKLGLM